MRVLIAEDNVLLAEGLKLLLGTAGHEVVDAVTDAPAFIEAAARHRPDVSIVDVRLPPSFTDEGVRAALRVRKETPGSPVLVLSQYVEQTYAGELLSSGEGGVGYLLKDRVARVAEFLDALERVAGGGTAMDPEVVAQLLTKRHDPLAALTAREREVLELMAQGFANGEIARRLVVTDRAVHKHVGNIFAKLDLPPDETGHRRVLAVLAFLG
ncbi:response regulator transcription factor [Amycolatopsis sp. 195334CR]|uniref:response regulator n=1 Tax=Amycolatopsis sp. 195334CR TaxID=2814588 RepID=UPI001A8D5191|nr:response regulator transcription factor [Amycolatopsis sp. 195334CR]MBN6035303.1 response regulator transcription factor [Amycolatopsis sp. 195334CR]